jgi:hypothetical protein
MRLLPIVIIGVAVLTCAGASTVQGQGTQPPTRLPTTRVTGDTTNMLTVQNDRASAVTVFIESGAFDRRIGVVPAGKVGQLTLPAWAVRGQRSVQVFARADGESGDLSTISLPLGGSNRLGLLIPPKEGLAICDSLGISLSKDELASTTLTVANERAKAVTVFAEQGTFSVRLGDVAPGAQVNLRFPVAIIRSDNSIRVFARPAGGLDLATQALRVQKGEHLAMRITP